MPLFTLAGIPVRLHCAHPLLMRNAASQSAELLWAQRIPLPSKACRVYDLRWLS